MKQEQIGPRQFQLAEFLVLCALVCVNVWLVDKSFGPYVFGSILPVVYYGLISVFLIRRSREWFPLQTFTTALLAMLLAVPGASAWCYLHATKDGIGTSAAFAPLGGGVIAMVYATIPLCGAIVLDCVVREVAASRRVRSMLRKFVPELQDWLLAAFDAKEKRFRTELRSRDPNEAHEERDAAYSDSYRACASLLRRVLSRELQFDNLRLTDNFLANSSDLPIDEVLAEVFEELHSDAELPTLAGWDGSFGHLVRLVDEQLQLQGGIGQSSETSKKSDEAVQP